ncbi:MAG: hypothetical protein ACOX1V_02520 [Candidatus Iainarchaeum sp.]
MDYSAIDELARFDGRLSEESKQAITKWAPELTLDFGTPKVITQSYPTSMISGALSTETKTTTIYPSAMVKLLSNKEFMEKFFNAYKANTGETCIPLYIPYKDILEVKLVDGMNYGARLVNKKTN